MITHWPTELGSTRSHPASEGQSWTPASSPTHTAGLGWTTGGSGGLSQALRGLGQDLRVRARVPLSANPHQCRRAGREAPVCTQRQHSGKVGTVMGVWEPGGGQGMGGWGLGRLPRSLAPVLSPQTRAHFIFLSVALHWPHWFLGLPLCHNYLQWDSARVTILPLPPCPFPTGQAPA